MKIRKYLALLLAFALFFSSFTFISNAAESDLQEDFDNGLINFRTAFTYYKPGVGHSTLRSLTLTENNVSAAADYIYNFSKIDNPSLTFGHIFELKYADGRVLMPQGNSLTFTVHNFVSLFYVGPEVDEDAFNAFDVYWLDMTLNSAYFMYFYDFSGKAYRVDSSMYDVLIDQEDAMITVKMKSDIYDFDVYSIRLFIQFGIRALTNAELELEYDAWPSEEYFTSYGIFRSSFGYENLYLELDSDEEATTGLLTSIIEYVKSIWDSIKNLPANIKTALTSLFDGLSSAISGFFDSLKTKLTNLFKGVTDGISNLYYSLAGRGEEGDSDYIPSLWQRIIDGIKGLFVPDEDYMSDYSDKWDSLLSQRLGAVYQVSDVLINSWKNVTDVDTQKTINIPKLEIPLPDNNKFVFGPYDVNIVPDGFSFLFDSIRLITSICIVVLVFNGLRRKYDEVVNR